MHYTLFVWTRGDGRAVATAGRQALAARRLLTIKQAKADARHGHARKAMVYSPHMHTRYMSMYTHMYTQYMYSIHDMYTYTLNTRARPCSVWASHGDTNSRKNPQIVGSYHTLGNETLRLLHFAFCTKRFAFCTIHLLQL